jgi:hypothetical protein
MNEYFFTNFDDKISNNKVFTYQALKSSHFQTWRIFVSKDGTVLLPNLARDDSIECTWMRKRVAGMRLVQDKGKVEKCYDLLLNFDRIRNITYLYSIFQQTRV